MLVDGDKLLTLDKLMLALETPSGWLELALALAAFMIGLYVAKRVFRRLFAEHPERYERFLPYAGFRLVLPLAAQLLVIVSGVLWRLILGEAPQLLPIASAMLFWLGLIRVATAMVRQALPKGRFERTTEHFLATLFWLGFVSWAIGVDTLAVEWLESIRFHVGKVEVNLYMILTGLLWVAIILVGSLWVSRIIESRVMKLADIDLSLRIVFTKLTRTVLLVAGVMVALPIIGIDLTVLSVFGGALGVGLGFGLQKIASNYVSGFIILLDRSIRIGDRLMIDNRTGYVTKITSRYVVLKTADGSEALVPNDTLIANTVVNQSYSDKSIWTSVTVQVGYDSNLELALQLVREAAIHPRVLSDPAPASFVTAFADSGINLELGFWVADPENGFLNLKSEINLAIWRAFKQHGINIPFPQREVRILAPAGGDAA
ncbi:mechanosensitive ion channel family protein [Pseudogulbenkiania sp. MAI-1]|uniref:mechanosensitive ion channel family protein n=1 Tax=Pseudogulbenkiania sp. MAI-1 TaxID=990370 RepID=UPI0004BCA91A|nr:mechanosensitive ion channel domain-containing protein [Pseudogulbenkiania sp. MAI-1]